MGTKAAEVKSTTKIQSSFMTGSSKTDFEL